MTEEQDKAIKVEIVKKPWYKRWWGITIIIFIGLIVIGSLADQGEEEATTTTEIQETKPATQETQSETNDPSTENIPEETEEPAVETEEAVEETKAAKSLTEIYDAVSLGMTEEQVKEVAGEPAMTSSAEIQQLGEVTNLVYSSGMDSITVSVQNGSVKMIVIGEWNGDKLNTRSKM